MDNLNIYLLGKLDSNVFENSREFLQFSVKSIIDDYKDIVKEEKFNCFVESIYKYGLIEGEGESKEDRFYDFLKDRLVIFNPIINSNNPSTCNEIFVKKPENFKEEFVYKAIPVFSKKNLKISFEEFKQKLINKEWIDQIEGFSQSKESVPNIIFFEDEERIYALAGFTTQLCRYGKVIYDYDKIYVVEENEAWYENFVRSAELEDIIFVEENTALEIENLARMSNAIDHLSLISDLETREDDKHVQEEIIEKSNIKTLSDNINDEESKGESDIFEDGTIGSAVGDILGQFKYKATDNIHSEGSDGKEEGNNEGEILERDYKEGQTTITETNIDITVKDEDKEKVSSAISINEGVFLRTFMNTCRAMNLLYDEKDLINFHTAMKSSKLVILSGMSGTGKSKIVQAYGKALGLDENRLNFISVRPSWGDDSDLLGYVDSINNIYRPGDSRFIDTLIEASNNKENIYIICLDEMNLARVEHYFSQILSVLELDRDDRILKLYNEELEGTIKNSNKYKANIKIGNNILLVGTVNLDESTYHFSDKVLDRANVITLNQVNFLELKKLQRNKENLVKVKEISFREYEKMIDSNDLIDLKDRELELLSEINEKMNFLNKNVGIGFRIITQIDDYIRNIPKDSIISREEGIDIQLTQRILPKIRGTKEQWGEFIGEYDIYDDENSYSKNLNSELIKILDNYKDVSDFKTSRKYILNKARELSIYGYTL
ncbi:McrB family protein [Clostridium perfringens]|uniref:McrB family protein n=1 Tax=Clostridium perfringens TaxID=1502 RepID=UPI0018E4123F|nr:hypothetical protein [Clostridium perfringens]